MLRVFCRFLLVLGLFHLAACGDDASVTVFTAADVLADAEDAAADAEDVTATDADAENDLTSTADSADVVPLEVGDDATATDAAETVEADGETSGADAVDAETEGSDAAGDAADGTDAEGEIDAAGETDAAEGTDAEIGTDGAAGTDTETGPDAETGTDAQAGTDAETDAGAEVLDETAGTDAAAGCVSAANCDDGDSCTGDVCLGGTCVHFDVVGCSGVLTPCDEKHACTSGVCDPGRHACVPCVSASDCGNGHICQENACVPAGICKSDIDCKASGMVCDKTDGACVDCNLGGDCQKGFACVEHACIPAAPCGSSKDCPAVCDVKAGNCVECLESADCNVGFACNPTHQCVSVTCSNTICSGGAAFSCTSGGWSYSSGSDCNDGNACTIDTCDNGTGCTNSKSTGDCTDENACTGGDNCSTGICTGSAIDCDDKNVCTSDSCDPVKGCVNLAMGGKCDDGDACTSGDLCGFGVCAGTQISCDDAIFCTTDSCSSKDGCRNVPSDVTPCDDGDACTDGTTCSEGKCANGKGIDCNDGNVCTSDSCSAQKGCIHAIVSDAKCSDGDACTAGDTCKSGTCTGAALDCDDLSACTADSCTDGKCAHVAIQGSCDDGNGCTVGDSCVAGKCSSGQAVNCVTDSKGCGSGECKSTGHQSYVCSTKAQPDGTPCDADGNACTVSDNCQNGACQAGKLLDCSQYTTAESCQISVCDPKSANITGCSFVNLPAGSTCSDGDGCTPQDFCNESGICKPSFAIDCNKDPATCMTGNCQSTSAHTYQCTGGSPKADGTPCNSDNSGCTIDTCSSGKCASTPADCSGSADSCHSATCVSSGWNTFTCSTSAITCNDGNGCTNDACVDGKGCVFTANTASCSDGNACTLGDICGQGKCQSGTKANCDDGNACTNDNCDSGKGCVATVNSCSDGNACTADFCDTGKGCSHQAIPNCTSANLPYFEPFNCDGGAGWTLGTTPENGVAWAIDGTPSIPGWTSPGCSLNFNNGVDFECTTAIKSAAVSPTFDASNLPVGSHLAIRFHSAGDWEAAPYDVLTVESSTDGGKNWNKLSTISPDGTLVWSLHSVDGTPLVGSTFQIRFNFVTSDCINNATSGGFIDDFAIVLTSCVENSQCSDKNDCTSDTCDKLNGVCVFTANGNPCSDGNLCTLNDACAKGTCTPTANVGCNDGNSCTADSCDTASGKCVHAPSPGVTICSDGNVCTVNDFCLNGSCLSIFSACDDSNPCTIDSCSASDGGPVCSVKNAPDGTGCDDGNACTTTDICTAGACGGTDKCVYTSPYSDTFPCGSNNWSFPPSPSENALSWGIDASPASSSNPGYYSASCSLNFNDGSTYGSVVPVSGTAKSGKISMPAKGQICQFSFYSFGDLSGYNGEFREATLVDASSGKVLATVDVGLSEDAGAWTAIKGDCSAAFGHTVTIAFTFTDAASPFGGTPTGTGWFVDDVKITAGTF